MRVLMSYVVCQISLSWIYSFLLHSYINNMQYFTLIFYFFTKFYIFMKYNKNKWPDMLLRVTQFYFLEINGFWAHFFVRISVFYIYSLALLVYLHLFFLLPESQLLSRD